MPFQLFTYHTIITGHEHLNDFGLINMNGRMYDPVLSSFLSPDNYMQDPTSQQGFNRYAYCMYNPLKYVDPTGEQYFGWNGGSYYDFSQDMKLQVLKEWEHVYDVCEATHNLTLALACSAFSEGPDTNGNGGGNHGSPGGGVLNGGINEPTFLLSPATYWGGPFDIIFINNVYIKPKP